MVILEFTSVTYLSPPSNNLIPLSAWLLLSIPVHQTSNSFSVELLLPFPYCEDCSVELEDYSVLLLALLSALPVTHYTPKHTPAPFPEADNCQLLRVGLILRGGAL